MSVPGENVGVAWISKYALTEGIVARRVEFLDSGMVWELREDGSHGWGMFHRGDWHRDRADAEQKAEVMRLKKIASVKKQLARLEALSFSSKERASD